MKQNYAIILNPVAGKGRARAAVPTIEKELQRLKVDYELLYTNAVWHGAILARTASERGFSVVVAAGGDGTCNEVINGLMACQEETGSAPVLGVLPVGRGNDFAYGAGIPRDLEGALQILASEGAAPLDVGRVTGGEYPRGRYFGNGIGIGFDTIVGLEAARNRYLHGALSYVYGALRTLIIYPEAPRVRVAYNGSEQSLSSPQISILNGRRMGGTFFMAPDAEIGDGLFDLCMAIRPLKRGEMMRLMVHYLRGTQAGSPLIATDRAPRFSIDAPEGGLVCHADGETICTDGTALTVECIPATLSILNDPRLPEPTGVSDSAELPR
jgi:diacylglycerol kinase (ATP)